MTIVFDDVRLPEEIEQGSTGGPTFNTSVVKRGSGKEARNRNWIQQKMAYDVAYGLSSSRADSGDPSNFYAVMNFFYARNGRYRGFRFKDWTDYQCFNEPCAVITGGVQLQKTYTSGPVSYSRKLTRPVNGTLVLFTSAGAVINAATYVCDYTTGQITGTFAAGTKATFEFDVPVRFDTDVFTMTIQLWNAAEITSLPIMEVLE